MPSTQVAGQKSNITMATLTRRIAGRNNNSHLDQQRRHLRRWCFDGVSRSMRPISAGLLVHVGQLPAFYNLALRESRSVFAGQKWKSECARTRPPGAPPLGLGGWLTYTASFARFADGKISEGFLNNHKSNSSADTNARDSGIAVTWATSRGSRAG